MKPRDEALVNMHKAFLDALRHREQEILRFVAILGTALGGFVWILGEEGMKEPARFVVGTYGVLLVLVVGASYALALGYNYRYLTLQLAKLEAVANLRLKKSVLRHWPREPEEFEAKCRWGVIPWCTPPGIIKVFWVAFLVSILWVSVAASVARDDLSSAGVRGAPATRQATDTASVTHDEPERRENWMRLLCPVPYVGTACFLFALLGPIHVGKKMLIACAKEDPNEWNRRDDLEDRSPQPENQDGRERQDKH